MLLKPFCLHHADLMHCVRVHELAVMSGSQDPALISVPTTRGVNTALQGYWHPVTLSKVSCKCQQHSGDSLYLQLSVCHVGMLLISSQC